MQTGSPEAVLAAYLMRGDLFSFVNQHEATLRDLGKVLTLLAEAGVQKTSPEAANFVANQAVSAIFAVTTDTARWTTFLSEFTGHFNRFGLLAQIGEAAVKHLPNIAASPLNHAAWDAWVGAWEAARATLPEKSRDQLDIPLRLLRTGIAWLKTKDDAQLLALPSEERRVLREALQLPPEKQP